MTPVRTAEPCRRLVRPIYAAARVIPVDTGGAILATVYRVPGCTAVACLDRSLDGSPHRGRVLNEVMLATAVVGRSAYLVWHPDGDQVRVLRSPSEVS